MLADAGARLVILGHSERRKLYGETSAEVAAKVAAALRAGLEPIVCVGEHADEHAAGQTLEVVLGQVAGSLPDAIRGRAFAMAYEPIWAIGSGRTPTAREIEAVHAAIRAALVERWGEDGAAPILYGGSVNGGNAAEILAVAEVGGALVGGASLTANQFLPIVRAA
jgi:triosephosphate isomerase